MLLGSPSLDLKINVIGTIIILLFTLTLYFLKKKAILSLLISSFLTNLLWYYGMNFNLSNMYNLHFFYIFINVYWPIINLILFLILTVIFLKNVFKKKRR
jgi:L-lactate permease